MQVNVWSILIAILIFGLIIFVHELGHFLTAKAVGVRVNEFAIGMGPVLVRFGKKTTRYSLRLLPIGGYVSMEGEDESSDSRDAFCNKKLWQRFLVLVAGATMNILLGFVVAVVIVSMQPGVSSTVVGQFDEQATSNAMLQINDKILRVNGVRVHISNDVFFEMMKDGDGSIDMQVLRDGEKVELVGIPFNVTELEGQKTTILDFKVFAYPKTFWGVVSNAWFFAVSLTKQIWYSLLQLFSGQFALNQLSGPVGITSAIGEAASTGSALPVLILFAFITINVGIVNLLPLPALDGGRLLFLLIELVIRRPVPARYEAYIHTVGFMALMGLIVYVTFNDLLRLIRQ